MTKAIIDELNIPGLTCEYKGMEARRIIRYKVTDRAHSERLSDSYGHALSLITINDPKYNIKGSYFDDATWDCKNKDYPNGEGYAFFMYPVSNISNMKTILLSPALSYTRATIKPYSYYNRGEYPEKGVYDEPIPFNTLEKAVKRVYSLEKDFCRDNDPLKTATEDIDNSLIQAMFRQSPENPLAQEFDNRYIYTRTFSFDKDGICNGEHVSIDAKRKEKDSGMEMS